MALIGEMLLITAFFLIVGANINLSLADVPSVVAGSVRREAIVALVFIGFGIKAGALGLHMWLPLAHPVAPTPASAILSGALIKAGLLGWLRFLPLGIVALPQAGLMCVGCGLVAAFYAIAVGFTQRDPKTILAYSSISQMGFMTTTLGVALAAPELAEVAIAVIVLYAVHHALAKAALFLGIGVAGVAGSRWPRRLVLVGLALPALDLAGAPLTSGALAKLAVKGVIADSPWGALPFGPLLSLGSAATALLLTHLLVMVASERASGDRPRAGLWVPWAALLVANIVLVARPPGVTDPGSLISLDHVWSALWPVVLGVAIYGVIVRWQRWRVRPRIHVPPGDILVVFRAAGDLARWCAVTLTRLLGTASARVRATVPWSSAKRRAREVLRGIDAIESSLAGFGTIGLVFLALASLGILLAWIA
jgi:formate hydrogenlyase subunit 3/multisubunit Na+/H+ antiporter MnhD subunit